MERKFQIGDEQVKISASQVGKQVKLITESGDRMYGWERLGDGEYLLREDGKQHRMVVAERGKNRWVWINGVTHELTVVTGSRRERSEDHGGLTAPMNGLVLKVFVTAGEKVKKKQPLVVLEAMKMQYEITAPRDGVIASINCREGDQVQGGANLVSLEPEKVAEA